MGGATNVNGLFKLFKKVKPDDIIKTSTRQSLVTFKVAKMKRGSRKREGYIALSVRGVYGTFNSKDAIMEKASTITFKSKVGVIRSGGTWYGKISHIAAAARVQSQIVRLVADVSDTDFSDTRGYVNIYVFKVLAENKDIGKKPKQRLLLVINNLIAAIKRISRTRAANAHAAVRKGMPNLLKVQNDAAATSMLSPHLNSRTRIAPV